jgi:oligoribonuclease
MIDVSSIGGVAWRWYPEECKQFHKQKKHTAREDILQSIAELKHFRATVFKTKQN